MTGEPVIGEWEHAAEAADGVGFEQWKSIMAGVRANRLHRGMKRDDERQPPELRTRRYLFSGTLRCGRVNELDEVCRSKLTGNRASGKNAKYGDYYRCQDANCKGVGRRAAAVDEHLVGLLLAVLDRCFTDTEAHTTPWRGREKLAKLRHQHRSVEEAILSGQADWSDVHHLLTALNGRIEALVRDERDHLEAEAKRNLLRGWRRDRWEQLELGEQREVVAQVFDSVVVLPIPAGVSDKAPFDPDLLEVEWRGLSGPLPPRAECRGRP